MLYQSFHDYYPEVAEKETRCLTLHNDPELPSGTYGFIESYCNDPNCDCRRVFLNVYHYAYSRQQLCREASKAL